MKDLHEVIRRPIVTEKITEMRESHNRYCFEVARWANKHDIKRAVEVLFKVKVEDVNTMNFKGKVKRLGRSQGARPDWKKAIVKLAKDNKIELVEGI